MKRIRVDIPVVFICDDNYAMPTAVAITSMFHNCGRDTSYRIYIFGSNLSENSKELLTGFKTDVHSIFLKDISSENYSKTGNSRVPSSIHVSKAALCKFDIANIIREYDKIIYLDGDVIVKKDLKGLYGVDLGDKYAAVVKDMKPMVNYNPTQVERLGVNHSAYFNTGMMVLNLEKMRADNLAEQLFEYRNNGINYFMDQDAFNVIFKENVFYLDYTFNLIYSDYEFFPFQSLKKYYRFPAKTPEKLLEDTVVLHLSSKEKPWIYNDLQFSKEWYDYYQMSPYSTKKLPRNSITHKKTADELRTELKKARDEIHMIKSSFSYKLGRKITELPRKYIAYKNIKNSKKIRYTKDWKYLGPDRDKKIIISLTSFPDRINVVPKVLESLMKQTVKPDEIILYLASEQFEERRLPKLVQKARRYGVKIEFCKDLKPHKKYYNVMRSHPNDLIITVDDDVMYPPILIERLYKSYLRHPECVSANRVHRISFNNAGEMLPYNSWKKEFLGRYDTPSMSLIATGIGGVLYPPHSIPADAFDEEKIEKTCLFADDLWLKVMEVRNNIKVVLASKNKIELPVIEKTQTNALWTKNVDSGGNDAQLSKILSLYEKEERGNIINKIHTDYIYENYQVDHLNKNIHPLAKLISATNLNEYLEQINKIKSDIIVAMFINDTAEKFWHKIKFPKFMRVKKKPKFREAYVNVRDFNNAFFAEYTEKDECKARYHYEKDGINFEVVSRGYRDPSSISFVKYQQNNEKYMYSFAEEGTRGLFLFVFSKNTLAPLDFIRVDVHKDDDLKILRF